METLTVTTIEANLQHAVDLGLIRAWSRTGAERIAIVAYGPDGRVRPIECASLSEADTAVSMLMSAASSPVRIAVSRGGLRSAAAGILIYGDPGASAVRFERRAAIRALTTMLVGGYDSDRYDEVFVFVDDETRRIVAECGWPAQNAPETVPQIDRFTDALIDLHHSVNS